MLIGKNIPVKYILKGIIRDLLITMLFVFFLLLLFYQFRFKIDLPINIPAFLGTAITLILSFKLNQSYDRWWEARKIWGAIVNDSRTLIFQFKNYSTNYFSKDDLKRIVNRQVAWCYELTFSLRSLEREIKIESYLTKEEIIEIKDSTNIPMSILDLHHQQATQLLESQKLSNIQFLTLENTIQRLTNSMGQADRIKKTVFPITYRIQLRALIYLFLLTLVISLKSMLWYNEALIVIAVAIPFFLLEKTAFLLQDPFENRPTDTPISAISENIERNLNSLIKSSSIQKSVTQPKADYFIL